ncbi:hypothetical protein EKK97_03460 [Billgrantia tianxiuensis]|uniref:Uncharacterized protein n=1 Tax=Billgrantia tianxiuensis TaxID=2497861 RepID=A0A6I6SMK9_9GAMM|nr:hypothetical protein EKK97_03460 [Halomonas tianxiuensis]
MCRIVPCRWQGRWRRGCGSVVCASCRTPLLLWVVW